MGNLEIQKNGEKYDVRVSSANRDNGSRRSTKNTTSYYHVLDKNPAIIAQILLDLDLLEGFPIEKAIQIYRQRKDSNRDWLGLD